MHRTGPQRPGRSRFAACPVHREITGRFRDKALPAFGAAKEIAEPAVLGAVRSSGRIDAHAANRIAHALRRIVLVSGGAIARISGAHEPESEERAMAA